MICKNCNAELTTATAFCPNCGAPVAAENPQAAPQQPQYNAPYNAAPQQPQYNAPYNAAPQQQYAAPQQQYGAPQGQYGAPQQQYGAPQGQYGAPQGQYGAPQGQANQSFFSDFSIASAPNAPGPNNGKVDFLTAIKLFFKNYTNFSGRASRSEFWWCYLLTLLCGLIPVVGWILSLFCLIPSLAVGFRRLHDTGKSAAYYFMALIPFVGAIIVLIQMLKDSDGDNQYGPANPPVPPMQGGYQAY